MRNALPRIWIALTAAALFACVPVREIRTDIPAEGAGYRATPALAASTTVSAACNVGSRTPNESRRMIEDYGSHVLAFAEFDDQGWSSEGDRQLLALQQRLQAELRDPAYKELDFVIVVFVHGWHHNAHDNDCNVQEARQMVRIAAEQFDTAFKQGKFKRQRRVFGIYVGWRGESVNAAGLRYITVIDRRDVAEKVAKGSVRQLLANLREQQRSAQAAATERTHEDDRVARMYTTVVGHSFGGLIVFNALSQQLITGLTEATQLACAPGEVTAVTAPWPDSVVLINPAFEASRFEPLNRLADRAAACGYVAKHPLVTVITADNDRWTGRVFTAARHVITLFEGYDESTRESREAERNANLRAIGFVDRYRTHRICLRTVGTDTYATASPTLTASSTAKAQTVAARAVWVVGAPPDIVDGHDGFLYARKRGATPQPYLLAWLVATHVNPQAAISGPGACGKWP